MTAPARSELRRRTEQVLVRMTAQELETLDWLCEHINKSRAETLRLALLVVASDRAAADIKGVKW